MRRWIYPFFDWHTDPCVRKIPYKHKYRRENRLLVGITGSTPLTYQKDSGLPRRATVVTKILSSTAVQALGLEPNWKDMRLSRQNDFVTIITIMGNIYQLSWGKCFDESLKRNTGKTYRSVFNTSKTIRVKISTGRGLYIGNLTMQYDPSHFFLPSAWS